MQMTKLGIKCGTLAGLMFFAGLIFGELAVLFIAAYILIVEENKTLKKMAKIAMIVAVVFAALSKIFSMQTVITSTLFAIFNNGFSNYADIESITFIYMASIVIAVIKFLTFVGLAIYGLAASYIPEQYVHVNNTYNNCTANPANYNANNMTYANNTASYANNVSNMPKAPTAPVAPEAPVVTPSAPVAPEVPVTPSVSVTPEASAPAKPKFCSNCGQRIGENAKVCGYCGKPINNGNF